MVATRALVQRRSLTDCNQGRNYRVLQTRSRRKKLFPVLREAAAFGAATPAEQSTVQSATSGVTLSLHVFEYAKEHHNSDWAVAPRRPAAASCHVVGLPLPGSCRPGTVCRLPFEIRIELSKPRCSRTVLATRSGIPLAVASISSTAACNNQDHFS